MSSGPPRLTALVHAFYDHFLWIIAVALALLLLLIAGWSLHLAADWRLDHEGPGRLYHATDQRSTDDNGGTVHDYGAQIQVISTGRTFRTSSVWAYDQLDENRRASEPLSDVTFVEGDLYAVTANGQTHKFGVSGKRTEQLVGWVGLAAGLLLVTGSTALGLLRIRRRGLRLHAADHPASPAR